MRVYIPDLVDDLELAGEGPAVRFLCLAIEGLAANANWRIPDDAVRIARRLSLRTRDVRPAIDRLVELGRLHRLTGAVALEDGSLQMRLSTDDYAALEKLPRTGENAGDRPGVSRHRQTTAEPPPDHRQTTAAPPPPPQPGAQTQTVRDSASRSLAQSRAEQKDQELDLGKATTREDPARGAVADATTTATALPPSSESSNPILNRLIGRACKGDTASASFITHEAQGLPDHVLARTLESLLGRRPAPANPAGYVVNTLRSLRAELGLEREQATVDREPDV